MSLITYAHHGNLLIDCGREVYYPSQILLGKILYKDIFNIYGPFAYMFNAFLFKSFGINLNTLYISGWVCAFFILNLIYFISRKFLSEFLSFAVAVFTISVGVLNLNLFNFIFPYSYAMLYGLIAFLISIFFLFKYQENSKKNIFLYLSCFFAGICITSKYEFLPYIAVIIYAMIKIKQLDFKQYYFAVLALFSMPVFCFGVLFLQGLKLNDLITTFLTVKKMSETSTLKYFYIFQGVYFNKLTIIFLVRNFLTTILPLGFFFYGLQIQRKILSFTVILLSIILMIFWTNPVTFAFLPLLVLISGILCFKELGQNVLLMLLAISAITISIKVFWGLTILNYGVFFVSFLLITVLALAKETFKNKNIFINEKFLGIYILILSIIIATQNLLPLSEKNYPVKTQRGIIYTYKDLGASTTELINYINKNTQKTDKIIILPEGALINFLTDRKTEDYYNSFIPLYIETFGQDKLIEHFKKTRPEYIIFNSWNTKDYYFKYICHDYANSFCGFIYQNYYQDKLIEKKFRYLIFKKNKKKGVLNSR